MTQLSYLEMEETVVELQWLQLLTVFSTFVNVKLVDSLEETSAQFPVFVLTGSWDSFSCVSGDPTGIVSINTIFS